MIRLTSHHLHQIELASEAAYPEEACGLLIGRPATDDRLTISEVAPSANVAPEPRTRRFEVDPSVRIVWEKRLRGAPEAIVGLYHSHPDQSAEPSATDLGMAYEPDLVWLITSVMSGRAVRTEAHRVTADRRGFEAVGLDVIDPRAP